MKKVKFTSTFKIQSDGVHTAGPLVKLAISVRDAKEKEDSLNSLMTTEQQAGFQQYVEKMKREIKDNIDKEVKILQDELDKEVEVLLGEQNVANEIHNSIKENRNLKNTEIDIED
ncbi:hypothetical protein CHS0354_040806 [Potamilus streckersoni]|uniref:Uncharacterized protein n=1 Tax=Potamilus streckersoni TaxID=2493646 RepID=A0AAE0VXW3_9BIVA|nr:hypothetical protein CHS0354_040806 [Potamilus streckersoni]